MVFKGIIFFELYFELLSDMLSFSHMLEHSVPTESDILELLTIGDDVEIL